MSESVLPFLVDAHLHPLTELSREHFYSLARQLRISSLLLNSSQEKEWKQTQILATSPQGVKIYPFYGLHPWHCVEKGEDWFEQLQHFSSHAAGIGEIGLDTRHFSSSSQILTLQKDVFRQQIHLAQSQVQPVVLHCIHAWHLLFPILKETFAIRPIPLLFHGYNASGQLLQQLSHFPAWFSMGKRFFQQNPEKAVQILRQIPPERLLLESDATTAEGLRQLPDFYERIASHLNVSLKTLCQKMDENLQAFLHAAENLPPV